MKKPIVGRCRLPYKSGKEIFRQRGVMKTEDIESKLAKLGVK